MSAERGRVTGIGGIFFKSAAPADRLAWYARHLGIEPSEGFVGSVFPWRKAAEGGGDAMTIWSLFPQDTPYFGPPGGADFMVNYRVDDLEALLAKLTAAGVEVLPERQDSDFGRFAWIIDPDGRRVELWEPPEGM
ncbi:MAG: VOC family protein [bacterium]